jgi:predicted dehydrogenase
MVLRVAVIGCGAIAHAHLPAIHGAPGVEVAGVLDVDLARARALAAQFGVGVVYDDWAAVLADDDVDVVDLLLPHHLHRQYAVEALAAGRHVMCEKPLATTLADCDAMIAAAERAGRALMPCHTRLFEPATPVLRGLIDQRRLGEIYLAQTAGIEPPSIPGARPWLGRQPGDGVLMAQAVHVAYLLRYLVGPVVEVSCFVGAVKAVELAADDTAVVLLRFASGAVAEMTATFGQRVGPGEHTVTLYGRDGWASYRVDESGRTLHIASDHVADGDQPRLIDLPEEPHFQTMWQRFAEAVTAGAPPPVTAADGRAAVEIILAAYQSAAEGRPVRLPL